MRLKSLELVGFKSFLDPTLVSFSPGITAVVGPNGCGKSNVVDAIRWVLGEQAPTRLRGKTTEDLIHAGNDSNPAAGMAEVSLTLEADVERALPEPYTALSEVCVTRRVYRSGDSDYLLNKIPCRLKDITEFFMAAQIHSRGYALIEQGRIEEIIQAKPTEIRALVEEAAGLSLFKGRREMSERKLERVKENLARLDDVLAEIERQLSFARRQAKKAEAYRLIRHELDELERLSAARRLLAQRAELDQHSNRDSDLKGEIETARRQVGELQSETEALSGALRARREQAATALRELENVRAGVAERARTREFLERRLAAIDERTPALIAGLDELEHRATAARAARAETGARVAREKNLDDGGEAALAALKSDHDDAAHALDLAMARAEELKDELSDLVREAAVIRGRLADLNGETAELEERARPVESARPELEAAHARAEIALHAAGAALEAARAEIHRLELAHREGAERELEARTALERLAARIAAARQHRGGSGPHESPALNGAGEKLRTVLESLNGDRPATDPAFLFDVVSAPAELKSALGAVLGSQADAVIIDSPDFALRAIEILKSKRGGRMSFIPQPDFPPVAHEIDAPGIAGRLIEMVSVRPGFESVAEATLGHVLVADDLASALAASNLNGHGAVFVTRDGDLLAPGRMISGGSAGSVTNGNGAPAHEAPGEVEIAKLEAEERELAQQMAAHREVREQITVDLGAARERASEAERTLSAERAALAKTEQELSLARAHREDAARRMGELAQTISTSNARLAELAIIEHEARARLATVREEVTALRTRTEITGAAMLEAASRFEARKAQLDALAAELRHLVEAAAAMEAQIDANRRDLERAQAERADFERELSKFAGQDEQAGARDAQLSAELDHLNEILQAQELELETLAAGLKQAREALAALEAEAVECALRREHARTLSEELARAFAEKFRVEFETVAVELDAQLEGRDAEQDEERLIELRAKAERIGEVNLAAESEVKELEDRAGVLSAESADLQAAVRDLTSTITKLNREARKRFAETFEGAAKNFAELFPKLMRGGKARLELAEADDVLEAGVNIMVQPAGKKVKEIGLLSGGEKALSAMALVFSLFLLNPSPFCVLDEVDAPLDEFSLAAFTSLVGELKPRSQFIIITHNQRTMQAADQIHGVTMDRPGVSRIISLTIPQAA
jgi:chromosome segregation protein